MHEEIERNIRVKNKFFTLQVCAASSTNIGTLAARKGGSQHEYKRETNQ